MSRADDPLSSPPGEPDTSDPAYAYRPSLAGAAVQFRLRPDSFEWRAGWRSRTVPYERIRRIRLSFRPLKLTAKRYLAEVWDADGGKVMIASTSWKSIAEQEPLDAAYRAFLEELHRRLIARAAPTAFETGLPPWLYWPGVAVFVGTALGLATLTAIALKNAQGAGALFVGGFLALFLWRLGGYFRRNRPGTYRPDVLPPGLVPPGS